MFEFVHLFPQEKFVQGFISFLEDAFDTSKHLVILYGEKENFSPDIADRENVIQVGSIFSLHPMAGKQGYYHHLKAAKKIFAHSLSGPAAQLLVLTPWLHKKLYVYYYGYEIYWLEDPMSGLRQALYRYCIKAISRGAAGIVTIVEGDARVLRRHVMIKGKTYTAQYRALMPQTVLDAYRVVAKPTAPYLILLGNSASPSNRHIEVLERLVAYADEPIKVLTPLSYGGDPAYGERVAQVGRELLGEKFTPLTDFMPLKEYYSMLAKVSVCLMNNDRQQGLGAINLMCNYGGKLYMRPGTTMWEAYAEKRGHHFFDITEVGKAAFEDFISYSAADRTANRELLLEYRRPEYVRAQWAAIFDDTLA